MDDGDNVNIFVNRGYKKEEKAANEFSSKEIKLQELHTCNKDEDVRIEAQVELKISNSDLGITKVDNFVITKPDSREESTLEVQIFKHKISGSIHSFMHTYFPHYTMSQNENNNGSENIGTWTPIITILNHPLFFIHAIFIVWGLGVSSALDNFFVGFHFLLAAFPALTVILLSLDFSKIGFVLKTQNAPSFIICFLGALSSFILTTNNNSFAAMHMGFGMINMMVMIYTMELWDIPNLYMLIVCPILLAWSFPVIRYFFVGSNSSVLIHDIFFKIGVVEVSLFEVVHRSTLTLNILLLNKMYNTYLIRLGEYYYVSGHSLWTMLGLEKIK